MQFICQLKYLHFSFTKPDFDSALEAYITDCAQDVMQILITLGLQECG